MYGFSPERWKSLHWTRQIRFKAYCAVNLAIYHGDIPAIDSSTECVDCGGIATCYDHRNYFYPLTIDPVCKSCDQQRGQGWPPPEGPAIVDNGVPFQIGHKWSNLEGGSDKVKVGRKSANLENRTSEYDAVGDALATGTPRHIITALNEMNGNPGRVMSRGDLRAEYFKKHDPYYICEDVA